MQVSAAQKRLYSLHKEECSAIVIEGDFADYIIKNEHLVINSGKDGEIAIHYKNIVPLLTEIIEISEIYQEALKGKRQPLPLIRRYDYE